MDISVVYDDVNYSGVDGPEQCGDGEFIGFVVLKVGPGNRMRGRVWNRVKKVHNPVDVVCAWSECSKEINGYAVMV